MLRKDVLGKEEVDVSTAPRYCACKDLVEAISKCHINQEGHLGIHKTEKLVRHHYANASRTRVEKFIASCSCQLDRKHPSKPDDVKTIISSTFNSTGQIDLINLTAYPDGKMNWILHYQDHCDKMSYLTAMPDREAKTIAMESVPILLMQGEPVILQSDNGREFVAKIIDEMLKIWKDCKIVHGSPRRPQCQGSVERANADVLSMVMQMDDEDNTNWAWGIQFIAHRKNNRYHEGIKQIPYVLRYGQPCHVGLSLMNLPPALLQNLWTEEDLEEAMEQAKVLVAHLNSTIVMQPQNRSAPTAPATAEPAPAAPATTDPVLLNLQMLLLAILVLQPTQIMLQLRQQLNSIQQQVGQREGKQF